VADGRDDTTRQSIERLVGVSRRAGPELALFLVYDRADRVDERPGLRRAYFAQRCVSDEQLRQTVEAFRSLGAYVELFAGERPFIEALASGRLHAIDRRIRAVYNGIEGSIAHDAFRPGRKALLPAVADSYGVRCINSSAYACALGRHKFHYLTVLRHLGLPVPDTWHFRPETGWAGGLEPPHGIKVIAKSTYESWSVGVTDDSVFIVDDTCTQRAADIAHEIGQAVTVQEFIAGSEVCVPVLDAGERLATPPVEAVLAKAPRDPEAVMTIDDNLADGGVTYVSVEDQALAERLRSLAVRAFEGLELGGLGRVDFRVGAEGNPYVFDIGVSPGLSTGSSAFASFEELGFDHPDFLRAVVGGGLLERGG